MKKKILFLGALALLGLQSCITTRPATSSHVNVTHLVTSNGLPVEGATLVGLNVETGDTLPPQLTKLNSLIEMPCGNYQLKVEANGYQPKSYFVALKQSYCQYDVLELEVQLVGDSSIFNTNMLPAVCVYADSTITPEL